MYQENFWILISKNLSGEASETEKAELEKMIADHPQWQYAIQNIVDIWNHQPVKDEMHSEDAYLLHMQRMSEIGIDFSDTAPEEFIPINTGRRKPYRWYWTAAVFFSLVIAAGILYIRVNNREPIAGQQLAREVNEISTQLGSKSQVELPDGSVVWLNGGSRLTYNKDFGKLNREVMLEGEGYFDVVKMKEKPFIIRTANINIKVLGTVFNVKAYPKDKQTVTSLIRGRIEVTIKNRPNDKIFLTSSEKLVVENEPIKPVPDRERPEPILPAIATQKLRYIDADSAVAETEWIHDRLIFNDETFEDLALSMERWYNVKMEIRDPALRHLRLTGKFEKETIQQALDALKISTPFRYEREGAKIIIY